MQVYLFSLTSVVCRLQSVKMGGRKARDTPAHTDVKTDLKINQGL